MAGQFSNTLVYVLAAVYTALRPPQECQRCGNAYPRTLDQCPRCEGLEGDDLEELRDFIKTEEKPMRDLKFVVIVSATVMTLLTILSYIVLA